MTETMTETMTISNDSTDELPQHDLTMIDQHTIVWAMTPRGKYAHAYPNIKALEAGVPLCGVKTNPTQILEHFDLSNEIIHEVACPDCLARLALARYLKPMSELYKPRKIVSEGD